MNKTMKCLYLLSFLLIILIAFCPAQNQKQPPQYRQEPAPVSIHQIKGNIYEVKGGSGANAGFFIGYKEALVIDAKTTKESAQQMIAEIKKLTPNPIHYVLLTHSDGDHVGGLVGFPEVVTIISHQNTKKDMDEAFKDSVQRKYLPKKVFSERMDLKIGDKLIQLLHFGPAHTDGDVVVYFPEEKVAFIGDLIFFGRDPLIHRHKNGNSFGLVKTLKSILELDADTFVHGHGDIASKSDIKGLVKSIEEKQSKIKELIQEGHALEEIKRIFNVEDQPARPGRSPRPSFVEVIYLELTENK